MTSTAALADLREFVLAISQHAPAGSHRRFSDLLWADSGTSDPFLNSVTPLMSASSPDPTNVARALQACAGTRSPFTWWFHDHLPPAVAAAGFEVGEPAALMSLALPAHELHPTADRLVTADCGLTEFFAAASTGFEDANHDNGSLAAAFDPLVRAGTVMPLVVRDQDIVVGTLLLHLGETDRSRAGIYWVATIPAFRGNGIASALVHSALQHAVAAKRTYVVLQSSLVAEHLYHQLGFTFHEYIGAAERVAV